MKTKFASTSSLVLAVVVLPALAVSAGAAESSSLWHRARGRESAIVSDRRVTIQKLVASIIRPMLGLSPPMVLKFQAQLICAGCFLTASAHTELTKQRAQNARGRGETPASRVVVRRDVRTLRQGGVTQFEQQVGARFTAPPSASQRSRLRVTLQRLDATQSVSTVHSMVGSVSQVLGNPSLATHVP